MYQALMLGLRDYIHKNGFPGVLIGLSGGIDSAISATIAVDALGPDAVHGIMMPSEFTSVDSMRDAEFLAWNLGIKIETISIKSTVESFHDALTGHLTTGGITFENIQPRARGIMLMAMSNAQGKMVLTTGNKSEMAVGYATLYGDMCGGFNVLKDVYKTQVYDLANWRNEHKPHGAFGPTGCVIPPHTITRPPTAELRPNQTDQESLPPYDVLDAILQNLIEEDLSVDDIVAKGFKRDMVLNVWKMLDRAEYKRRQAPPGIKITRRAFGRDRRYPITNNFSKNLK
jgi:NAD+ synthase